jgi:predicted transcriptional regulator
MMKEIKLHVAGLDALFSGTTLAAQAIDAGATGEAAATLAFETMETLLTVLTAGRWQLLRSLRRNGPTSIRHLAQLLKRDYRAVHRDVHALLAAGLIDRDTGGAISVPWERITAEMAMDLAA